MPGIPATKAPFTRKQIDGAIALMRTAKEQLTDPVPTQFAGLINGLKFLNYAPTDAEVMELFLIEIRAGHYGL